MTVPDALILGAGAMYFPFLVAIWRWSDRASFVGILALHLAHIVLGLALMYAASRLPAALCPRVL